MARKPSPGCAHVLNRTAAIGMYGFSYQGMTQLLAAAEQPEGLLCIAPGMTACDLYHGWFYQHGALRLASSLGWGLQMLKADARRKKLREASDRLEHAWANLAAQSSVLPFREHPALHGEGVPQYVRGLVRPRSAWRVLGGAGRSAKAQPHPSARTAHRRMVRHVSWRQRRRLSGALQLRRQRVCAPTPILDRRTLAAHPLGRSRRDRGFRRGSAARYGLDPVTLVQPLAEGFG